MNAIFGFVLASSAIRRCFVDTLSGFKAPSVFPIGGSVSVALPFPRSGPREAGSPMSSVVRERYDFPCPMFGRLWIRFRTPRVARSFVFARALRRATDALDGLGL